ncbi:MAG: hypothetical protein L3J08_08935 [Flavobacteriaceae bacterium]|nr:hypothetical protein [Flavobacteriaceae bacterium]
MRQLEFIEPDRYYHIYNRGINGGNIFYSNKNYTHFLKLYDKYISSVDDAFAWYLLKNNFHLLVKIKTEKEILALSNVDIEELEKRPSQQFSHLFNAYAQAINKQNNRHGSLFEKPFRRKKIEDEIYIINFIIYIHNNPIQYGFTDCIETHQQKIDIISLKK